jgi:hypothetical protein
MLIEIDSQDTLEVGSLVKVRTVSRTRVTHTESSVEIPDERFWGSKSQEPSPLLQLDTKLLSRSFHCCFYVSECY